MVPLIVVILVIIWILGYSPLEVKAISELAAFYINGKPITFLNIVFLLTTLYFVSIIPRPFKQIGLVVAALWVAALLGYVSIPWLEPGMGVVIIIGLIFYAIGGA